MRPFRLSTGALLAASLAACGGPSGGPESSAPAPAESAPVASNGDGGLGGIPGNYLPGPDALVCTDRAHDVEIAKGTAPGWADLQGASWERSGQGVTVSLQLAVKVPQQGPAAFTAAFWTGSARATATIRLDGRTWTVTVAGRPVEAAVQPVVRDLVVQLPVELGTLNLNRRVTVAAAATGGTRKTRFTDPACAKGLDWKPAPLPTATP